MKQKSKPKAAGWMSDEGRVPSNANPTTDADQGRGDCGEADLPRSACGEPFVGVVVIVVFVVVLRWIAIVWIGLLAGSICV